MIILYIISIILLFSRQYTISKDVVAPIYIYIAFSFIYTFFPYVYLSFGSDVVNIELGNLTLDISETVITYVTITNIIIFLFSFTRLGIELLSFEHINVIAKSKTSRYLFFVIYPFVAYFVGIAPWPEYGEEFTLNHSIAAFLKTALIFLFCAEIQGEKKKRYLLLLFILMCVIFVIDSSRTFFFVFIFALLFVLKIKVYSIAKNLIPLLIIFFVFVFVTLSRNDIPFSFDLVLWPFYSEGIFGSYGAYNVVAIHSENGYDYSFMLGYFIDLFSSILVNEQPYYATFLKEYSGLLVNGKVYPFGGHFFLSDAVLYFNYLAPFFYAIYFYLFLFLIYRSKRFPSLYVFLLSNFFFIVKTPIFVFVKTLILIFIIVILYGVLLNVFSRRNNV
ncbi:O-antigen polymerase [Vibrio vulnificus]|uniref:O-antigen polymerase n=1 Tax=Vibrio vulnificus TaxID=672 RepID=UPI003ED9A702